MLTPFGRRFQRAHRAEEGGGGTGEVAEGTDASITCVDGSDYPIIQKGTNNSSGTTNAVTVLPLLLPTPITSEPNVSAGTAAMIRPSASVAVAAAAAADTVGGAAAAAAAGGGAGGAGAGAGIEVGAGEAEGGGAATPIALQNIPAFVPPPQPPQPPPEAAAAAAAPATQRGRFSVVPDDSSMTHPDAATEPPAQTAPAPSEAASTPALVPETAAAATPAAAAAAVPPTVPVQAPEMPPPAKVESGTATAVDDPAVEAAAAALLVAEYAKALTPALLVHGETLARAGFEAELAADLSLVELAEALGPTVQLAARARLRKQLKEWLARCSATAEAMASINQLDADLEDEEGRLYGDGGGDDHDAGSTTGDSSMAVDAVAAITTSGNPTANQNATQYKSAPFSDQKFGDLPASFSTPAPAAAGGGGGGGREGGGGRGNGPFAQAFSSAPSPTTPTTPAVSRAVDVTAITGTARKTRFAEGPTFITEESVDFSSIAPYDEGASPGGGAYTIQHHRFVYTPPRVCTLVCACACACACA